ncbi:MAG TPA: alpha/beta hydrolase [Candidatus Saccharimonadales bacterium]|nr:alpha/beta hydrolase [Candidatus Saccharimonadales bacterium]
MQVVVDSLLTHYETLGKGKTVVLLHGWGDSAAGLAGLQKALAGRYRVLTVDLPGFGTTQVPPTVWGLDEYATFVLHFLQKVAVKNVAAIVGHSNGGAVALRGVAQGVLNPDKLVLLAAAGIRVRGGLKKLGFKALAKGGKAATVWLPAGQRDKLRHKLYKSAGSDMLVVPELQETFKKTVAQDLQADAAKLTLPVLLVYGEQDAATPVWYGECYHELMGSSTLEILPGAGHFVHLDRPDDVVRAIEEFVQ